MHLDSNVAARFWVKVSKSDSCWIWTGTKTHKQYGIFHLGGKRKRAHQIAYMLSVGPIPEGLQLDHLCRNPSCVNPAHLEPVTSRENTLRGIAHKGRSGPKLKEFCKYGHPYAGDNLYVARGRRYCRTCMKAAMKKFQKTEAHAHYQKQWRSKRNLERLQIRVDKLRKELGL